MRLILSGLCTALLPVGGMLIWSGNAIAAVPECQKMSMKTSSGTRDVLMCKDDKGRWYEAAAPELARTQYPGALPQKARVTYQGDYVVKVTKPPRRNSGLLGLVIADSFDVRGAVTYDLVIDGQSVTGTSKITAGNGATVRLSGTIQNGYCKLYSSDTLTEGQCDASGFSGRISSTGSSKDQENGTCQSSVIKVIDVAGQDQQRLAAIEDQKRKWQAVVAKVDDKTAPISERLNAVLTLDSSYWNFNRYVDGSVANAVKQKGPNATSYTIRGDYQSSVGGGWVRAVFVNDKVNCLEFHDFPGTCRAIGQPTSSGVVMSAAFTALSSGSSSGGQNSDCSYGSQCSFDNWQEGRGSIGVPR